MVGGVNTFGRENGDVNPARRKGKERKGKGKEREREKNQKTKKTKKKVCAGTRKLLFESLAGRKQVKIL